MDSQEAKALLNELEPQQSPQAPVGLHSIHQSFQQIPSTTQAVIIQPTVETPHGSQRKLTIVRKSRHDQEQSRINQFVRPIDVEHLREEYTALWYEKLALESSAERLLEEGRKKDDLIAQLTV